MPSEHVQDRVSSLVPRVLLWCWGQDSPCSLFQDSQCLCGGNEGAFFSPRWCGEGVNHGVRGKFPFAGASPLYLRTSQQGWGVRGEPLSVLFHQQAQAVAHRPLSASPVGFPSQRKPGRVSALRLHASVAPEGGQQVGSGRPTCCSYPCAHLSLRAGSSRWQPQGLVCRGHPSPQGTEQQRQLFQNKIPSLSMKGSEKKENQTRQRVHFRTHSFIKNFISCLQCVRLSIRTWACTWVPTCSPATSPSPCRGTAALFALDSF